MKILAWICAVFECTFADTLDNAIKRASNLYAEYQKHYDRVLNFQRALHHVDPNKDWNLFAILKEKHKEASAELTVAHKRYQVARDRAEQLIDQLRPVTQEVKEHALHDIDVSILADAHAFAADLRCAGLGVASPTDIGFEHGALNAG